jgi:ketosteroid isomerase-like protein
VSAASLQIVRDLYEAFARRDLPAVVGWLAGDCEIRQTERLPSGGRYRGHDGARQFFAKLTGSVDSMVTVEPLIDAEDHVAVVGRTVRPRGHDGLGGDGLA